MTQARSAAGHANAAARDLSGAARHAAHAAGQAAAVAHVAAHELGAAAYAIKAARAAAPKGEGDRAGRRECSWQRERLPEAIRDLVLDDQRRRGFIVEPRVEKDGNVSGKPRAEVGRGIHLLTRPAPIADKGCRDQEDRAKLPL